MKLYFSGAEGAITYIPERILNKPAVMVSYFTFHEKMPGTRIKKFIENFDKKGKTNENQ